MFQKIKRIKLSSPPENYSPSERSRLEKEKFVLIITVFMAGLCSIIYELLISTTSSYFLGDSVKQFSLTIGIYLAAMGVGSFLSRVFQKDLLKHFIAVEILLGFVGGISVPLLYLVYLYAFSQHLLFNIYALFLISIIGILTGLEIPLLARIMKKYYPLEVNLSNVLGLDYLGGLAATLLFPFFLLPFLGLFKASLVFGLINVGLGLLNLWYFSDRMNLSAKKVLGISIVVVGSLFALVLGTSNYLLKAWGDGLYKDPIVFFEQTNYQQIALTQGGNNTRLYINGAIQFSSLDEYRYHESLIHIPLGLHAAPETVLVLGGGEALAVRELLKHKSLKKVVVVDIDPAIFQLARENRHMKKMCDDSLSDPRVETVATDAFVYLQSNENKFDIIIGDLPDPATESVARLYSKEFFRLVQNRLKPNGIFCTQATGTYHSNRAFWCIHETLKASGFKEIAPYHAYVPSFGDWGFIAASNVPLRREQLELRTETSFLEAEILQKLFYFPKDLRLDQMAINTLDQPILLDFYLEDFRRFQRFKN